MPKQSEEAKLRREAEKRAAVQNRIHRRTLMEFAAWHTHDGKLIDVKQAAEIIGITERRVRTFIMDGRLPAVKISKLYLIKDADLEAFMALPRKPGPIEKKDE